MREVDAAQLPLMLTTLRLPTIGRLWHSFAERADREGWGAARYLAALCEHELAERTTRRIARHLAQSGLPQGKTFATFEFAAVPTLRKAHVMALGAGDAWLEQGANILLFGPSGSGKSHVAAAIGHALIDTGRRVLFSRTTDLVQKLQAARRDLALPAQFHHVEYSPDAIDAAVYQSSRYVTDRFLPDKAIDLLDEAGARAKLREAGYSEEFGEINKSIRVAVEQMEHAVSAKDFDRAQYYRDQETAARENLQFVREKFDVRSSARRVVVGRAEIDDVVSKWTGVPLSSINQDESDKLLRMEEALHRRVVSQEKAISALSRAIRRSRAGLRAPTRPVGSFMFLGPTGVGKTELARALAHFLFGSETALIRFDMSEYMEKHSVSKLIGSPPGYVGHEEGGQLTERVKRTPYSVVLLDEIEKAHPDIFNILLQVFEDGHLTDGLGNRVNFKNAILIMTSNIGARFIQKRATLGFQADGTDQQKSISDMVLGEVRRTFNPEFINRIDELIVFDALSDDDLRRILGLLISQLNANLADRRMSVRLASEAMDWIIDVTCKDRSYGARPLRRAIQRHVEDPLAEELIRGRLRDGEIEVYLEGGVLAYRLTGEAGEPVGAGRPLSSDV